MAEPERLLTIGQAAKRLNMPVSTLRDWANAGHVRAIRTPTGRRLFRRDEIDLLAADLMPPAIGEPLPEGDDDRT